MVSGGQLTDTTELMLWRGSVLFYWRYINLDSDSLRAGRSGYRILLRRDFPQPSKPPWGPPSLLYNGYRFIPRGKGAGAWRWPPTPSSAEVKERVELYLYSPSGLSWPFLGWTLPLPLPLTYVHLGNGQHRLIAGLRFLLQREVCNGQQRGNTACMQCSIYELVTQIVSVTSENPCAASRLNIKLIPFTCYSRSISQ